MKSSWLLFVLAFVVAMPAATAGKKFGKQVRFAGMHPIPKSEGGGICYIEGPHVHIYVADKLEYRVHDDDHVFVGDPVAHGYDGEKYAYKGPHPMRVEYDPDVEYCYIEGPHYHAFAPPEGPDFKLVGGAYFYVGQPPRAFIDARPTYVGINAEYKPLRYARPVIEVDAPDAWIGLRAEFVAPAVIVAPAVHVEVPGVIVQPAPVIVVPHGKFKHKKFKGR